MRKRIISVITIMILSVVSYCYPAAAEESQAVGKLLTQISALMDYWEQTGEIREEIYRAVREFCEENDYESLLNARLVCDEASGTLMELTCPELILSEDELLELMQLGIETDVIEAELQGIRLSAQNVNDGEKYEELLYVDVYQKSQTEALARQVSLTIQMQELLYTYDCNTINYLLNPIAEYPGVMEYWEQLGEKWPVIGVYQSDWEESQDRISESTETLLDTYEALSGEFVQLVGRNSYSFEQFSSHIADADLEALRADTNQISGMPVMLPFPSGWLLPKETACYTVYEGEDRSVPSTLTFVTSGVTLEDYRQYITELESVGAAVSQMEGTDTDGWETVVTASGSVLVLDWDPDGTVMAAYDPQKLSLEAYSYILCV